MVQSKEKILTPRVVEFSTVCGRISPRIRNGIRKYFMVLTRGLGAVTLWKQREVKNLVRRSLLKPVARHQSWVDGLRTIQFWLGCMLHSLNIGVHYDSAQCCIVRSHDLALCCIAWSHVSALCNIARGVEIRADTLKSTSSANSKIF
jgi:hypothetical protein